MEQLEGRNPVLECLARGRRQVHEILLDRGAKPDPRVTRILELADTRGVAVRRVARGAIDRLCEGRVHNGIVARVDPIRRWTTREVLNETTSDVPFYILVHELAYEHNLGAILRSGLGFGVDALILPTRRGAGLSPVAQRVAMGAAEEVPVVREGLHASLKQIQKAGIPVYGAHMEGRPASALDLTGPAAFIMGGEGKGLPNALRRKCDELVSIPLAGQLESLNVSVAAALLMYEKRRQDGWF